jgi:mannan endo-1,4-beta-mannosidase
LQFWLRPDGQGQKLIIQLNSNGEDFEVELTTLAAQKQPQFVVLPFERFKGKNGGHFDKSQVQHFAIYCNTIGNASIASHLYFDDIQVIK